MDKTSDHMKRALIRCRNILYRKGFKVEMEPEYRWLTAQTESGGQIYIQPASFDWGFNIYSNHKPSPSEGDGRLIKKNVGELDLPYSALEAFPTAQAHADQFGLPKPLEGDPSVDFSVEVEMFINSIHNIIVDKYNERIDFLPEMMSVNTDIKFQSPVDTIHMTIELGKEKDK